MKKIRLLLFFIFLFLMVGCKNKREEFSDIYVGKVDIVEHIDEGPGNLSLKFFSYNPFNEIQIILDYEDIVFEYDLVLKNHPVKLKKDSNEEDGYMHLISVGFFDDKIIDISEVIMQFDNIYRLFDIGRYQRIDVESLSGVSLKHDKYVIDFILPVEITKYSYIPNVNIDIYVFNQNDFAVLSKGLHNINENPRYHLMVTDNNLTTPFITPQTNKVTKNIFLSTKSQEYVQIKTYFIYEFAYETMVNNQNIIARDLKLVCLEIGSISSVYSLNEKVITCDCFGVGEVINYIEDNLRI